MSWWYLSLDIVEDFELEVELDLEVVLHSSSSSPSLSSSSLEGLLVVAGVAAPWIVDEAGVGPVLVTEVVLLQSSSSSQSSPSSCLLSNRPIA